MKMMIKLNNLIIIPVKAHMAKPCDAAAKMLYKFQSSFRWRLMCVARDVGAKMTQFANLIIIPVKAHMAWPCDAITKMPTPQPSVDDTQSLLKNTSMREHQS